MAKRGRPKKLPAVRMRFGVRCTEIQRDIIFRAFRKYQSEHNPKATLSDYILKNIFEGIERDGEEN